MAAVGRSAPASPDTAAVSGADGSASPAYASYVAGATARARKSTDIRLLAATASTQDFAYRGADEVRRPGGYRAVAAGRCRRRGNPRRTPGARPGFDAHEQRLGLAQPPGSRRCGPCGRWSSRGGGSPARRARIACRAIRWRLPTIWPPMYAPRPPRSLRPRALAEPMPRLGAARRGQPPGSGHSRCFWQGPGAELL